MYATFFAGLGMVVVLSEVDPRGDLKANSGFCFPVQMAHGAVMDLARQGVAWVFLPHVTRMPQPTGCRDSYLCPITQPAILLAGHSYNAFTPEGMHPAAAWPLDRRQLERGLQHTSGRECLPLPLSLGQLLQAVECRRPGEITGIFMVRGGAPCVVDCYMGYFERWIVEQRLPDVFMFDLREENDYGGFDVSGLTRNLSAAIAIADILVEIEHVLRVVGPDGSAEQLHQQWQHLATTSASFDEFQATLPGWIERLAALPRRRNPLGCPRVAVTGDFFTRFSPFFMEGIVECYARHGIILKPVDLSGRLPGGTVVFAPSGGAHPAGAGSRRRPPARPSASR